ncbi:MAG: 2-hydroxyacid dehydrogenase [Alphaproteobacteria bacterium]|nr:2-hydroxyacid dehydrogenase [Alphaproteobacteria bacterium]
MKRTILALKPLLQNEMDVLENLFDVIRLWESTEPEETLRQRSQDIVGIVSTYNSSGVSSRLIEALPNLEIISQFGVGFDNIDLVAATKRTVLVTNTPDVLTDDTADIAIILMLNVARRAVEADMFVRVGRWHSSSMPLSTSICGKTVGIVGLGKIGTAIARRAESFNTKILYHSRTKKDVDYKFVDNLEKLAKESDFLILACSGGKETENLIDYKILQALGPKGYLINIARGSVVNEKDLLIALENKEIAGAGLDVYADEPRVPEDMIKMDNVVLLPHIGSATQETRSKMGQLVIENLCAHFEGNPLLTPVRAIS